MAFPPSRTLLYCSFTRKPQATGCLLIISFLLHGRLTCLKFSLYSVTNSSNCWAPLFSCSHFLAGDPPGRAPQLPYLLDPIQTTLPPGPNIQRWPTRQPAVVDRTEPVALPVAELFALWVQFYLAAKPVIITRTWPLFHLLSWQTLLWPRSVCVYLSHTYTFTFHTTDTCPQWLCV